MTQHDLSKKLKELYSNYYCKVLSLKMQWVVSEVSPFVSVWFIFAGPDPEFSARQEKQQCYASSWETDQKHICLLLDLPSLLRTVQRHSGKTQAAKLAFTSISFTAEKAKLR